MLPHGSYFCRPNFWDVKIRENPRFCVVPFFWDVKNWIPHTPVGAQWDEFAVGMTVVETFWDGMASILRRNAFLSVEVASVGWLFSFEATLKPD